MDSIQNITENELRNNGPIRIPDGHWVYDIIFGENNSIVIRVMYNGDRDIKRPPREQPRIVLPNIEKYEISYSGMFMLCAELTDIEALRHWDISNVTDMRFMFAGCTSLKELRPLRDWNISHVKRLDGMFMACHKLDDLTALSRWDLSSCINSEVMFFHCHSLNTLRGLENWKMPNNSSTCCMFRDCYNLNDISSVHDWDVSHIRSMCAMFKDCDIEDVSPLENWFVSAPEVDMRAILSGNMRISNINALSRWRWHENTNAKRIFDGCYRLRKHPLILKWMGDAPNRLTGFAVDDETGLDSWIQGWIQARNDYRSDYDPWRFCTIMHTSSYSW